MVEAEVQSLFTTIPIHEQRRDLPEGTPIDYRGQESGYLPDRIIQPTERVVSLNYLIDQSLKDKPSDMRKLEFRKKLFDLVVENAYGRVFPIPDSTSDVIGIPDVDASGDAAKFQNCIVLTKKHTPDGDKIAIAGAFVQVGEAVTQTAGRLAALDLGASNAHDFVVFDEESKPNRDPRKVIVTTCCTATVDTRTLPEDTYIFPLYDENSFELIADYLAPGTHIDMRGKTITHTGPLADHEVILSKLYQTWMRYSAQTTDGVTTRLNLRETMKNMAKIFPQKWFAGYEPRTESAGQIEVEGSSINLTPNIQFALTHARAIFEDYGFANAEEKALQFIKNCIRNDILPEYPQPAVTVDCIVTKKDTDGDKLLVQLKQDGTICLPGTFYSPEFTDAKKSGQSIQDIAQVLVALKMGVDFRISGYLGPVGGTVATEQQADTRYPRISHVYMGVITGAYEPSPQGLNGDSIIEIPIWKDKAKGILSDEILNGINSNGWAYKHNKEILIPLLKQFIETMDPDRKKTLEKILSPNLK